MPGIPVERRPVEGRHATLAHDAWPCSKRPSKPSRWMAVGQLGGGALGAPRQAERRLDHAGEDGDVVLVAHAGGTVELLAGAQHGPGDVDGVHAEGEDVGEGVGAVRVEPPQGEVGELAEPGHGDGAVGQLELHGLEGGDGLAELDAPVHVLHRQLHGAVAGAEDRRGGERDVEQDVDVGVALAGRSAAGASICRSTTNGPRRVPSGAAAGWASVAAPASGATTHWSNRSPWSTRATPSGTAANGRPSPSARSTDATG